MNYHCGHKLTIFAKLVLIAIWIDEKFPWNDKTSQGNLHQDWLIRNECLFMNNSFTIISGNVLPHVCAHFTKLKFRRSFWGAEWVCILTRLTWLIHTSVLPSIWNPGKIFAPIGQLGQAHMVKKIFLIFLHAGRWSFLLLNFWFSSKLVSKMN